MPTFSGDIAISTVRAINEDGTLAATQTTNVAVTKDQVVGGTTTIYNATITVSIYSENNLPVVNPPMLPPAPVPVIGPAPAPQDVPLYTDTLVSGDEPSTPGDPVPWTALIPKNTLTAGKAYTIIAKDSEDSASTTLGITT